MKRNYFFIFLFSLLVCVFLSSIVRADGGIKPYDAGDFCLAYDNALFYLAEKDANIIIKTHDRFIAEGAIESPYAMVINSRCNSLQGTSLINEKGEPNKEEIRKVLVESVKKENPTSEVKISKKSYLNNSVVIFCRVFCYKYEGKEMGRIDYFIFRNKKVYFAAGLSAPKDFNDAKTYFDDIIRSFSFD